MSSDPHAQGIDRVLQLDRGDKLTVMGVSVEPHRGDGPAVKSLPRVGRSLLAWVPDSSDTPHAAGKPASLPPAHTERVEQPPEAIAACPSAAPSAELPATARSVPRSKRSAVASSLRLPWSRHFVRSPSQPLAPTSRGSPPASSSPKSAREPAEDVLGSSVETPPAKTAQANQPDRDALLQLLVSESRVVVWVKQPARPWELFVVTSRVALASQGLPAATLVLADAWLAKAPDPLACSSCDEYEFSDEDDLPDAFHDAPSCRARLPDGVLFARPELLATPSTWQSERPPPGFGSQLVQSLSDPSHVYLADREEVRRFWPVASGLPPMDKRSAALCDKVAARHAIGRPASGALARQIRMFNRGVDMAGVGVRLKAEPPASDQSEALCPQPSTELLGELAGGGRSRRAAAHIAALVLREMH